MQFKVCLIRPRPSQKSIFDTIEPLNLLSLATYLGNNDIKIRIIDEYAGEDVLEGVSSFQPDLVGFTSVTCTYPRTVELMRKIKSKGYVTILGGVHASALPERAIADGFDMVVAGEGEKVLLEIIQRGARKGIFRASQEMLLKGDEFPLLDRSLINMSFYSRLYSKTNEGANVPYASFISSRGCPYPCIFCHNSIEKIPIRFMKPELILTEIERLVRDYKIEFIGFLDDDFFIDRKRAVKFCELLIKSGIPIRWSTPAHPRSLDEEMIRLAAESGCYRIGFGFESGSQKILDILGKHSTVEQNIEVAKYCKKYGIHITALMLVGSPTESKDDIRQTWRFLRTTKPDTVRVSALIPYPGTMLWKYCKTRGYIPENVDFSKFYFHHASIQIPDTFPPKEVERIKWRLLFLLHIVNSGMRRTLLKGLLRHPFAMAANIIDSLPFSNIFLNRKRPGC